MVKKTVEKKDVTLQNVSQETAEFCSKVRQLTKDTVASKEKSMEFMARTGIYTPKGKLRKAYR